MNLHELLHYELWSKRTSKKIVAGLIVVFAGCLIWAAVEQYWVSLGERTAGRAALAQIDGLQNFASMGDQDFDAHSKTIEKQVAAAAAAAWTTRDQLLALDLSWYFDQTKIDRESLQRRKMTVEKYPSISRQDTEFADAMVTLGETVRLTTRTELHRVLGK